MEMQKIGNRTHPAAASRYIATLFLRPLIMGPLLLGSLFCALPAYASTADAFSYELSARVRHESVDFSGDHGNALTSKLRLNTQYQLKGWRFLAEVDYLESFLRSNHSDGVVRIREPVIADPRGTEFNQLFLQYKTDTTKFTLGRQVVDLDDHRFVGDVGFRQNDQTYDAFRVNHTALGGWSADYLYIGRVNRIFGTDAGRTLSRSDIRFTQLNGTRPTGQLGVHNIDGHVARVAGRIHDYVELVATGQSIHNQDHAPFSNRTISLGANIDYKSGSIKWQSSLIYARQQKQETRGKDWLSFSRIELSATQGAYQLSFRQEQFGSESGEAFITPLATLHKFQGWADQFLNTPTKGLRDRSILLRWRKLPYIIDARFHAFQTDADGIDLGRELNLDLIYKPNRDHEFKLRFADFDPDSSNQLQVPVKKLFLMYSYKI